MSKRKPSTKAKQAKLISMHMAYPLSRMKPFSKNPRNHENTIDLLVRSLGIFGAIAPIVLRQDGTIAAGHARYKAAKKEGRKTFPAIKVKFVDEEAFVAYVMADNQIATRSTWISAEFGELQDQLADAGWVPEDTGFDPDMIPAIRAADLGIDEKQRARADEVPAPPKKAKSRLGDLYILGKHRLLCGTCTDKKAVKRLLDGIIPVLLTDPPYCSGGSQEAGKKAGTWGDIASDNLSTRGYQALMEKMLAASPLSAVYMFTDWRMWIPLFDIVESKGHAVRSMLVWAKENPAMGGIWRTQHELIMFASRANQAKRSGEASTGNVLRAARTGNKLHYTEKPASLLVDIITNDGTAKDRQHSDIYDPFLGSGTTMIACEQLGRRCFAMEIEPIYIDVAVKRWETFTGKKAKRVRRG